MKSPGMQYFMSNRPIGKVSVGRYKELNALGFDDDCECALTSSSAFILLLVENDIDFHARTFLHLKDELLDWLTKTVKILGLHIQTLRGIWQAGTT